MVLTRYSLGTHRVLTGYSQGAHMGTRRDREPHRAPADPGEPQHRAGAGCAAAAAARVRHERGADRISRERVAGSPGKGSDGSVDRTSNSV